METVQENVAAAVEVYEMRTHVVVTHCHLSFLHGGVMSRPLIQLFRCLKMFLWSLEPRGPAFYLGLKLSLARDGDVVTSEGINQWRVVETLQSLPQSLAVGKTLWTLFKAA